MEGACGRIVVLGDGRVRKVLKRRRRISLDAMEQVGMHLVGADVCRLLGLAILYVPSAWPETPTQFTMEEITTTHPIALPAIDHPCSRELGAWMCGMRARGVFPEDFELYQQPDGRVALVDVDKFGTLKNGIITFPWGETMKEETLRPLYPANWLS